MIVFGDLTGKKLLVRGFFPPKYILLSLRKFIKRLLGASRSCDLHLGASPDVFYPSSHLRLFHHHDARLLPLPSRWTTNINVDHQPFLIPYETLTLVVLGESEPVTTEKVGTPSRASRNEGLRMEFKGLLLFRVWVGAWSEFFFLTSPQK
jgi:hypothetical protein